MEKSREDYLRSIYELTQEGEGGAKTSELADYMDVSDASATEALKKLEDDDLVCRAPYKGFTLSPMGRSEAEELEKKYQVLKQFFAEVLEVRDPEEQANAVEHHITEEAAEKIEELTRG
ncbi:MAG: metal-dependent transcriptional regulator [Candidatus Nanohaloarchaea archaeon]